MKAEWIWYPGEAENKILNDVGGRRYLRNIPQYPVWQSFGVYPSVKFGREFVLTEPDNLEIYASGGFSAELDFPGNFVPCTDNRLYLDKGRHSLTLHVWNTDGKVPCVYVRGKELVSDGMWQTSLLDGVFVPVGTDGFFDADISPNEYALPVRRENYVKKEEFGSFTLYDFGKESFGFIVAEGANGSGKCLLYFGESKEEALDFDECELTDELNFAEGQSKTRIARAYRYVAVTKSDGAQYKDICQLFEYKPHENRAEFRSDDEELTRIWNVAAYTFDLNTREFFYDGIKRDRWVWAGDAFQSGFLNRYSFMDAETWKRTIIALGGKGKIGRHINTIVDYTLYWLIGFYDYYKATKDIGFIKQWYRRFDEWMRYVLSLTDENGFLKHRADDWVFIDWHECLRKDMDIFSFLQILLYGALNAAENVASLAEKPDDAARYKNLAATLKQKINDTFYDEASGAYFYGIKDGKIDRGIFRQINVMAVFVGLSDEKQAARISQTVLKNDDIPKITTPYMRFFEFSVLCETGETEYVLDEIKKYYGGMLKLGATSFWEDFDPTKSGSEHYAMYGRKYGKSLCHAWGATPLWIIGRYVAGVNADAVNDEIVIRPKYVGIADFSAEFPTVYGTLKLQKKDGEWFVNSPRKGRIYLNGKAYEFLQNQTLRIE